MVLHLDRYFSTITDCKPLLQWYINFNLNAVTRAANNWSRHSLAGFSCMQALFDASFANK